MSNNGNTVSSAASGFVSTGLSGRLGVRGEVMCSVRGILRGVHPRRRRKMPRALLRRLACVCRVCLCRHSGGKAPKKRLKFYTPAGVFCSLAGSICSVNGMFCTRGGLFCSASGLLRNCRRKCRDHHRPLSRAVEFAQVNSLPAAEAKTSVLERDRYA